LGSCVTGDIADRAFDLAREILCRACNSILVHLVHSLKSSESLTDEMD
jgi:hypothetical protein